MNFPSISQSAAQSWWKLKQGRWSCLVEFTQSFCQILAIVPPDWVQIWLSSHLRWNCIFTPIQLRYKCDLHCSWLFDKYTWYIKKKKKKKKMVMIRMRRKKKRGKERRKKKTSVDRKCLNSSMEILWEMKGKTQIRSSNHHILAPCYIKATFSVRCMTFLNYL